MPDELIAPAYPPARNGYVHICAYCGEDAGTGKFCTICKKQAGRKKIFDENVAIIKENKEKGYAVPTKLRDWH